MSPTVRTSRWALLFSVLTTTACSHLEPFYHAEVPEASRDQPRFEADPNYLDAVRYRVILIGDAGAPVEPASEEYVLESAKRWAGERSDVTTVVFLGDNVYETGMGGSDVDEERRRIDSQVAFGESPVNAKVIFVPGNHDWDSGARGLQSQQDHVVSRLTPDSFLPKDGDPGPAKIDLPEPANAVVRLIALDTDWWLHDIPPTAAEISTFVGNLKAQLDTPAPVIVVAHHPLQTGGPHGGFYDWQDHLFPFTRLQRGLWIPAPAVLYGLARVLTDNTWIGASSAVVGGFLYPLGRRLWKSPQDVFSHEYRRLVDSLNTAFAASGQTRRQLQPLLFAAGHSHSLQVFAGGKSATYQVISGAGSQFKVTPVGHNSNTLFAHEHTGFMVVDFRRVDGKDQVWLRVIEPEVVDEVHQNVGEERATFVLQL